MFLGSAEVKNINSQQNMDSYVYVCIYTDIICYP